MSTATENGASTIDNIGINDNMGGDVIPSAAIDVIIARDVRYRDRKRISEV